MKIKYITLLFVVAIAITSCKKDRVCECTTTSTDGISVTDTDNTTYKKVTKRWMRNHEGCVSKEYSNGTKVDCEIK
jgi:hypothetical protein